MVNDTENNSYYPTKIEMTIKTMEPTQLIGIQDIIEIKGRINHGVIKL